MRGYRWIEQPDLMKAQNMGKTNEKEKFT